MIYICVFDLIYLIQNLTYFPLLVTAYLFVHDIWRYFLKLCLTPCKDEQPLQGIDLQEKEENKGLAKLSKKIPKNISDSRFRAS